MPELVGVRFKACGRIYDFEAVPGLALKAGDQVIVESELGLSIGTVVKAPASVPGEGEKEYKKVLRLATPEDVQESEANKALLKEAFDFCRERIMARGLEMKLIQTEATLDRKKIIFYFVADRRIDFRELVKDLAQKFRTRIEMRQVGVRDEARLAGGIGLCGRSLCCSTFLTDFAPITIRMAKKQELVLNTGKLSGCCGRLMCCLSYEYREGEEPYTGEPEEVPVETRAGAAEGAEIAGETKEAEPWRPAERSPERQGRHRRGGRRPRFERQRRREEPEKAEEAAPRSEAPPAETSAPETQAGEAAAPAGDRKRRKRRWKRRGGRPGPPPQAQ
jgi:cell fate regulator YaaT (PSP1 superfamily)